MDQWIGRQTDGGHARRRPKTAIGQTDGQSDRQKLVGLDGELDGWTDRQAELYVNIDDTLELKLISLLSEK